MGRGSVVGLGLILILAGTACGGGDDDARQAGTEATSATTVPSSASSSSASTAPSSTSVTTPSDTGSTATGTAGPGAVAIANFAFMPTPITVRPGGMVTWTNQDDAAHSIHDTSPLATPMSKSLNKGDTFAITYAEPGTYPYVCGIHNYMQGSVEVKN